METTQLGVCAAYDSVSKADDFLVMYMQFLIMNIVINAIMSLYCPADYVIVDTSGGVE